VLGALLVSGCGGSSKHAPAAPAGPPGSATAPGTALDVGRAIVTTNFKAPAPKKGALNRLEQGIPAPDTIGKANGRETLVAGTPDTSILGRLPQPQGLGAKQRVCASASAAPPSGNAGQMSRAVLCLLNAQRGSRGLRALRLNGKLSRAAMAHSRNMVTLHYFAHAGADGDPVSRIRRAGYIPRVGLWMIGENLAWGTGSAASPAQIMLAWMNSPEHKANILTPGFREIGIGIVPSAPTASGAGATFTTTFGAVRLR
jgi:uncharacterized protein YkwD